MSTRAPELTCRQLVELVTEYLEGALPPEERARVDAHLGECAGCRAYMGQMQVTLRVVRETAALERRPAAAGLLAAFRDWKGARPASRRNGRPGPV
jgi:predicted anti-sigma-YlaC factor YlaD